MYEFTSWAQAQDSAAVKKKLIRPHSPARGPKPERLGAFYLIEQEIRTILYSMKAEGVTSYTNRRLKNIRTIKKREAHLGLEGLEAAENAL